MHADDDAIDKARAYLAAHIRKKDHDSHISIAMPDGKTCRAYIPFQIYSTDEGGQIVRLDFSAFGAIALIVECHLDSTGETAILIGNVIGFFRATISGLP